jgi:TPR repeat protein
MMFKWGRSTAKEDYDKGSYYHRNHAETNYEEAVKWFRKAADKGLPEAQRQLGFMYDFGRGVTMDRGESNRWYKKAAEQGDAISQLHIGWRYYGKGIEGYEEAVKWFRKAAEQGFAEAQRDLGKMYFEGSGVAQSDNEAFKWYKKAAEGGDGEAQIDLFTRVVLETIPNKETALAFVMEEIEAAQHGNEAAKKFAKDNVFRHDGNDLLPEIDGPSGPQQTLTKLILGRRSTIKSLRFSSAIEEISYVRVKVVKNVIENWKLKETTQKNDDSHPEIDPDDAPF